jgi:plastocyanin
MKRLTLCFAAILWLAGMVPVVWAATIAVRSGSYYFEDATVGDSKIVARVGDRLQFLIEDAGKGTPHTVEIDALGIHSGPLGTSSTYTTPVLSQPGTFLLYCKPHQNKGHHTSLVVLANATPAPTTAPTATPTTAPTAALTNAPTPAPAPAPTPTAPPGVTAAPTNPASVSDRPTSSPQPAATQDGSVALGPGSTAGATPTSAEDKAHSGTRSGNEDTVATSGARQEDRAAATTWLRSVFVGLLALVPLLGLTGLAGWLSSRRRSS